MEKYSSGRRGAPAKGVGRETGARVQIPLSPLKKKEFCESKALFLHTRNFVFISQKVYLFYNQKFYGIVIKMYFRQSEHNPPHVHAICGECYGLFSILNGEMWET